MPETAILSKFKVIIYTDTPAIYGRINENLEALGFVNIFKASHPLKLIEITKKLYPDLVVIDLDSAEGKASTLQLSSDLRTRYPNLCLFFLTKKASENTYKTLRPLTPSGYFGHDFSKLDLMKAIDIACIYPKLHRHFSTKHTNDYPELNNTKYFFKIGDIYKSFDIRNISYFFSRDKMTFARIHDRNFPTNIQLKTLEKELGNAFIRIHKSYLIRLGKIDSIKAREQVVLIGNEEIPIGNAYKKEFLSKINLLK
ncbi:MAG: DNA-binding response regulator [Bacteroidetes bacterium]|nr:DNA-binding response regulator [Bacteroidota bacterium]